MSAALPASPTRWPLSVVLTAGAAALLLLAVVAAGWLAAVDEVAAERAHARLQLADRAALYAQRLAGALDQRRRLLALAAVRPDWATADARPGQATAMLAVLAKAFPDDVSLLLVDARGRVTASTRPGQAGADVSMRSWFNAARAAPLLTDPAGGGVADAADAADDELLALVVQPLASAAPVAPLLVARISTQLVAALDHGAADRLPGAAATSIAVLDRDGRLRGASAAFALPAPPRLARTAAWTGSTAGSDGTAALIATHPVNGGAPIDALGWHLVAVAPAPDDAAATGDALWRHLRWSVLVVALLIPLALLASRRVARPLGQLADALQAARGTQAGQSVIAAGGLRETAALTAGARAMMAEIAARDALADDSATGFRELFELHPLPMWVVDEQTLRFLEVNSAAVRKYGWSRAEFLAMTVLDLHPATDRHALADALANARDAEHQAASWQHVLRSGVAIDVEVVSRRLQWGGRDARIAAVRDVTLQRRATIENARQRADLSELAQRLMATEDAERRHLAQVLHDQFAPSLFGMKLSIEALLRRAAADGEPAALQRDAAALLAPVVEALDATQRDVRGLMSDLRPPLLADYGLQSALRHETERRAREAPGVAVVYTADDGAAAAGGTARRFDPAVEHALFMIGREALHNALLHAAATRITVSCAIDDETITISVRDDGRGFDAAAPPPAGHLGLVGMRERAGWIGAQLEIDGSAGGTRLSVTWQASAMPDRRLG